MLEMENMKADILCDCGVEAVERQGKWGPFYGCAKYKRVNKKQISGCRFTKNMKNDSPGNDQMLGLLRTLHTKLETQSKETQNLKTKVCELQKSLHDPESKTKIIQKPLHLEPGESKGDTTTLLNKIEKLEHSMLQRMQETEKQLLLKIDKMQLEVESRKSRKRKMIPELTEPAKIQLVPNDQEAKVFEGPRWNIVSLWEDVPGGVPLRRLKKLQTALNLYGAKELERMELRAVPTQKYHRLRFKFKDHDLQTFQLSYKYINSAELLGKISRILGPPQCE
jgi:hypothetical protein